MSFVPGGLAVLERSPWAVGGAARTAGTLRKPQSKGLRVPGSWLSQGSPAGLPTCGHQAGGPRCPPSLPNWTERGKTTQASGWTLGQHPTKAISSTPSMGGAVGWENPETERQKQREKGQQVEDRKEPRATAAAHTVSVSVCLPPSLSVCLSLSVLTPPGQQDNTSLHRNRNK